MRWTLIAIVVAVVGFALWVRLAPTDGAKYHVALDHKADSTGAGEARRVVSGGDEAFARLFEIAQASPRTTLIAGSLEEGHATFETRSQVFGFPDYTTIQRAGDQIRLWGRLRYGVSDMGVNAARLDGWLAQLRGD